MPINFAWRHSTEHRMEHVRDGLTGKTGGVSEDIVYSDMNNRLLSSTLTGGQELLNVGKAIELSKISADVGRTVFETSRTKIAS